MKAMIYEDDSRMPVSRCLALNGGEYVRIIFSSGNWKLAKEINGLSKTDTAIVFLDMPPNNRSACEMFEVIMQETKECKCQFVLVPVVCTEYYILKYMLSEECLKSETYRSLYRLLVSEFNWYGAVPYIIKAGIVEGNKPKSMEKIYKAILNNAKYVCLRNKSGINDFYEKECNECKYYNAEKIWNVCNFDKKIWSLQEKAAYIYAHFPAFYKSHLTEKCLVDLKVDVADMNVKEIAAACKQNYITMCNLMEEQSVFSNCL